jgi:hypothetical protein
MERGWFETIQLLGLDLQVAYVMLLLLLERLVALGGWLRRLLRARAAAAARLRAAAAVEQLPALWSLQEWGPSR